MEDYKIDSPAALKAALAEHEMSRRERLLKEASGGQTNWADIVSHVFGMLVAFGGFVQLISHEEPAAVLPIVVGLAIICHTMFRRQQRQIDALRKLLQDRERD